MSGPTGISRKLNKYMGMAYVKAKEDAVKKPSLADALVREDEEEETEVPTTKRHKSLRKSSTFVARSRWDILIEDEDVERLRKIVGLLQPKDPLMRLMKATVEYFRRISESVRPRQRIPRQISWFRRITADRSGWLFSSPRLYVGDLSGSRHHAPGSTAFCGSHPA